MNKHKENQEGESVAAGAIALPITKDQEQLSLLFGEYYRRVFKAAYRITGSIADAEDVAQTVFLRLASGDGPRMANAGSYLYRTAINGALDLLRRRRSAPTDSLEDAADVLSTTRGSSPEAAIAYTELADSLRLAIGELPSRAAEMFAMRYIEELGNREIAELMGTSQAVVAVTLFNARSRLKKRLRELERGKQ
jgi:RNA polymerase sigma factor (sigma-70 family)